MAHYAKTRIDAGRDKDGKARVFEVGQEVTGLPEDEIKQLQQAGSLSDRAPREGEPGYQDPSAQQDGDAARIQREREQAQRDAATSGVGGPSSQRNTTSDATKQQRDAQQRDQQPSDPSNPAQQQPSTLSSSGGNPTSDASKRSR